MTPADKPRSVILVIDDAIENLEAVAAMLSHDYEVQFATRAEQGLTLARTTPGPDLILCDVVMPGMDGFTACRLLKEDDRTRFIPVVIMTSLDAIDDRLKGIEAGADDFLTKPVDQRQLLARIRTALRAKHNLDERLRSHDLRLAATIASSRGSVRACPHCYSVYLNDAMQCALDGANLARYDSYPLIGRRVDRYEVSGRLGEGAMGCVYLASHSTLKHQRYAIKVLYGQLAAQASFAARFRREAEACAALDHPNVVAVLDFGVTPQGLTYLVMEYVAGRPLSEVIEKGGPLGFERAAVIARQIAAGLGHVHGRGLVHRDVKPQNVLIAAGDDGEQVKLLDFGVAGWLDPEEAVRLTEQGATVGTPLYMAPEQYRNAQVGPAADLYSLGVTLFEMLTGRAAFGGGPGRVAASKLAGELPTMETRTGLESLVRALMSPAPAERPSPQTVIDMIDEAMRQRREAQAAERVPARQTAVADPSHAESKPSRARWRRVSIAAIITAACGGLIAFLAWR
jgi:CheY-like chemotaxis protein